MPQAVETRRQRRPTGSTGGMFMQALTMFVPDTTRFTATGLEKPTRANNVPE